MNLDIPLCFPVGYAQGCECARTFVCLRVSKREKTLRELPLPDSVHVWTSLGSEGGSEWWVSFHLSTSMLTSAALISNEEGRTALSGAACYFRWESHDQRLFPSSSFLSFGLCVSAQPQASLAHLCPSHLSENAENLSKALKLLNLLLQRTRMKGCAVAKIWHLGPTPILEQKNKNPTSCCSFADLWPHQNGIKRTQIRIYAKSSHFYPPPPDCASGNKAGGRNVEIVWEQKSETILTFTEMSGFLL